MTNSGTLNTLHTLRPDGTWLAIKADNFKDQKCAERIMFDDADRVWVSSREWSKNYGGIYCLDYHGTLDNFSDDRSLFRSNGINEDGTSFDFFNLYDFAFDTEGWLWFGSDTGVFALKDPSRWFESSIRFYQPKVARNDGTNFADYLLNGIKVSAIAVDGANRKWLGTQGSGLYLVSPDGSEILQHFNVADSPILSDNIEALAFDPSNGALYIGTDVGLCQYSTNITSSAASLDKNNIKVYPNPVRPEYHGNLYITGLTEGAQVKILSAASRLVASGTAIGGTYSWDLANAENGERVSAGVYFVYIATADGKKATTVKVAVI